MSQLVNSLCVVCGERVQSIIENVEVHRRDPPQTKKGTAGSNYPGSAPGLSARSDDPLLTRLPF